MSEIEKYTTQFREALIQRKDIRTLYSISEMAWTRTSTAYRLATALAEIQGIDTTSRDKLEKILSIITVEQWLKRPMPTISATPGIAKKTIERVDDAVAKFFGRHLQIGGAPFYAAIAAGIYTEEILVECNAEVAKAKTQSAWPELAKYRREIRSRQLADSEATQ